MLKAQKYTPAQVAKGFRLTPKEKSRASTDGVVIISRPQSGGTYGIFAVDISDGSPLGINWYEVDDKTEISRAVTALNRDLDKFHGRGDAMSSRGRLRPGEKEFRVQLFENVDDPRPSWSGGIQEFMSGNEDLDADMVNRIYRLRPGQSDEFDMGAGGVWKIRRVASQQSQQRTAMLTKSAADVVKHEWENALREDEAMLKKYQGYLKKLQNGEKVENLTEANAKKAIEGLQLTVKYKKEILTKFAHVKLSSEDEDEQERVEYERIAKSGAQKLKSMGFKYNPGPVSRGYLHPHNYVRDFGGGYSLHISFSQRSMDRISGIKGYPYLIAAYEKLDNFRILRKWVVKPQTIQGFAKSLNTLFLDLRAWIIDIERKSFPSPASQFLASQPTSDSVRRSGRKLASYDRDWRDGDRSAPKTPWGPAQQEYKVIPGVSWFSTAGHGGMRVSPQVAKKMLSPAAIKHGDRWGGSLWYEEDIAWVIPAYENPAWNAILARKWGTHADPNEKLEREIRQYFPRYFKLLEEGYKLPDLPKVGDTIQIKRPISYQSGVTFEAGTEFVIDEVRRSLIVIKRPGAPSSRSRFSITKQMFFDGDVVIL